MVGGFSVALTQPSNSSSVWIFKPGAISSVAMPRMAGAVMMFGTGDQVFPNVRLSANTAG
jgi:hypothetical protein